MKLNKLQHVIGQIVAVANPNSIIATSGYAPAARLVSVNEKGLTATVEFPASATNPVERSTVGLHCILERKAVYDLQTASAKEAFDRQKAEAAQRAAEAARAAAALAATEEAARMQRQAMKAATEEAARMQRQAMKAATEEAARVQRRANAAAQAKVKTVGRRGRTRADGLSPVIDCFRRALSDVLQSLEPHRAGWETGERLGKLARAVASIQLTIPAADLLLLLSVEPAAGDQLYKAVKALAGRDLMALAREAGRTVPERSAPQSASETPPTPPIQASVVPISQSASAGVRRTLSRTTTTTVRVAQTTRVAQGARVTAQGKAPVRGKPTRGKTQGKKKG